LVDASDPKWPIDLGIRRGQLDETTDQREEDLGLGRNGGEN